MFNKITLGPITVYMYGLMIAIGFASALFLCNYRGKKRGLSEDTVFGIFLCALIGGMVGCRLLYYIVEIPAIMEDPSILWDFKNGYVVYGGIIGGIVTSYVYCRIKKENFISYFDLVYACSFHGTGIWAYRLFLCRMLLWKRDTCVVWHLPLHILILHQTV